MRCPSGSRIVIECAELSALPVTKPPGGIASPSRRAVELPLRYQSPCLSQTIPENSALGGPLAAAGAMAGAHSRSAPKRTLDPSANSRFIRLIGEISPKSCMLHYTRRIAAVDLCLVKANQRRSGLMDT